MTLTEFFASRVDNYRKRQVDLLCKDFETPFVMYLENNIATFQSRDELRAGLTLYFGTLDAKGVVASDPSIDSISLPRKGQVSAWVTWTHFNEFGVIVSRMPMRYFLRKMPDRSFTIQMIELPGNGETRMPWSILKNIVAA